MPQITPNVAFTNVSREIRCKWRDEETLSKLQDGASFLIFIILQMPDARTRAKKRLKRLFFQ